MSKSAAELVEHWTKLKAERAQFERVWQDVSDYIRPVRSEFTTTRSPGERRNQRIFDSTPLMAASNFAGGIYGMMTNPANRWFALKLEEDEGADDIDAVQDWLYACETAILNSFGPQSSRFYSVLPALYEDLACFGTAVFYSEEQPGTNRINDNVRPLSECVIAENAWGDVDTVYRRFTLTGKQALEMFPDTLDAKTRQRAEKEPFCTIAFIHCVYPNDDYREGSDLDQKNRPFASVYLEEEARHKVDEGGYYEMPYQVPRWAQAAGEVYGRGIGEQVLPDVKMLNRMDETSIKAAQMIANPPLAAPDEGVIKAARTWPGGITYGAVDNEGRQLLKPLYTGGDVRITIEMMEQRRAAIREAFFFSLMQMVGSPTMTATEVMARQEEKLRLLGPNLGRLQSEFLSPLVERRFGLLLRAGQLPPAPEQLQGQKLRIEYVSPLARAQMAGEAQAVMRFAQALGMMAPIDPSIMDNIDNDEAAQVMGRGWAVPAKVLRAKDTREKIRNQREAQQAFERGLAMAETASKAARNTAAASKDMETAKRELEGAN